MLTFFVYFLPLQFSSDRFGSDVVDCLFIWIDLVCPSLTSLTPVLPSHLYCVLVAEAQLKSIKHRSLQFAAVQTNFLPCIILHRFHHRSSPSPPPSSAFFCCSYVHEVIYRVIIPDCAFVSFLYVSIYVLHLCLCLSSFKSVLSHPTTAIHSFDSFAHLYELFAF